MLRIKECKALARRTLLGRYGSIIGAYFLSTAVGCLMWLLTAALVVFTITSAGLLKWTGIPLLSASFSFAGVAIGVMLALAMFIISMIVPSILELGCRRLMLNICRGRRYSAMDVFSGFKESSRPAGYIIACIILYLITAILNALPQAADFISALIFGSETIPAMLITVVAYAVCVALDLYLIVSFMLVKTIMADHPEYGVEKSFERSRQLMKGRKLKGIWLLYLSFILWLLLAAVCPPAILWISPYMMCTGVIFYMDADGSLWQLPGGDGSGHTSCTQSSATSNDGSNDSSNDVSNNNSNDGRNNSSNDGTAETAVPVYESSEADPDVKAAESGIAADDIGTADAEETAESIEAKPDMTEAEDVSTDTEEAVSNEEQVSEAKEASYIAESTDDAAADTVSTDAESSIDPLPESKTPDMAYVPAGEEAFSEAGAAENADAAEEKE